MSHTYVTQGQDVKEILITDMGACEIAASVTKISSGKCFRYSGAVRTVAWQSVLWPTKRIRRYIQYPAIDRSIVSRKN